MRAMSLPGLKEWIGSLVCLTGVLGALVMLDERVRDRFRALFASPSETVAPATGQLAEFGEAIASAVRFQSAENGILLLFAAVAALLLLFMLKT